MSKKFLFIFSSLVLLVISPLSLANATVYNIVENVDTTFDGNYFHDEVGPIGGITDTYQFTSSGFTNLKFFVSVNHDQGSIGVPLNYGINNLQMTWSIGNIIHTITSPSGIVNTSGIPFFHALTDGQVGILSVTGNFRSAGGGYTLSVSAVPLPPAIIAFMSAMLGVGLIARKRKNLSVNPI
ncbi:MAG: hypothetical protein R3D86_09700 [Emcibacteraceae bacterium]